MPYPLLLILRRRVIEPAAPWLQLHSCFDYARCANGFSVYV
jgi:hypothetical protein